MTVSKTTQQASDLLRKAAELQKENAQLKRLLAMLYDKWENGESCYEVPEDFAGFLGNAFKLKLEEEEEIFSALKGEPVTLISRESGAPDLEKERARLCEELQTIADFAVGHGDVCEIIARRARAALSKEDSRG